MPGSKKLWQLLRLSAKLLCGETWLCPVSAGIWPLAWSACPPAPRNLMPFPGFWHAKKRTNQARPSTNLSQVNSAVAQHFGLAAVPQPPPHANAELLRQRLALAQGEAHRRLVKLKLLGGERVTLGSK